MTLSTAPVRERIAALDVLRGFAVGGILLANVGVFFGQFLLAPDRLAALPTGAIDRVAAFAEHTLVDGKFYSIFSLLFGIGFGVQLRRGREAISRFRRRLWILLAIGTVHAFLIWAGDILMLYAMLGFLMPWFAKRSDRALLHRTVGLLATPTVLYLVGLGLWILLGPGGSAGADEGMQLPPDLMARVAAIGTGGFSDAFIGNLIFLVGRWVDLFLTVRFPKVVGMFVLGLWLVRSGIALDPAAHRPTLIRWRWLGLGIGLPANLLAAWAGEHWQYLPPSLGGLVGVVGQAVGVPFLALGYASAITLLAVDGRSLVQRLGPVGRMALSNYLLQSIVCVILSRGFGFGLFWRIGSSIAMAIALVIVAIQVPLSAWWLSRYEFGPAEWVWRRLTYRQPLPMRRLT